MSTQISKLRKDILKGRGVVLSKHTKKPIKIEDLPDAYPKTSKMKLIELRYNIHIEKEIFKLSLNDFCRRVHWDIDRSTASRWRTYITRQLGVTVYADTEE